MRADGGGSGGLVIRESQGFQPLLHVAVVCVDFLVAVQGARVPLPGHRPHIHGLARATERF